MTTKYAIVKGFPNYRVGTDGSVWSNRQVGRRFKDQTKNNVVRPWRLLTQAHAGKGYCFIRLFPGGVNSYVHIMVLEAFRGSRPAGTEARHLDGNKNNNRLTNLVWGTRLQNAQDRITHGTWLHGEAHWNTKLTNSLVAEIKQLLVDGVSRAKIRDKYRLSHTVVAFIAQERNWKHVPWPEPSRSGPGR